MGQALSLPTDTLATAFRDALCGPTHRGSPQVIWSDGDARILLHAGKLQVRTVDTTLLVAVDTESAEYGVAPLIARFVFGREGGPASLVAATDATAFGHPGVVARWGELFREVVWAAFARLVEVTSGDQMPGGVEFRPEGLRLTVQEPFSAVDLAAAHLRDLVERGLRPAPRRAGGGRS
jgi:hypothetical protein